MDNFHSASRCLKVILLVGGLVRALQPAAMAQQQDVFPIRLDVLDPVKTRSFEPGDLTTAKEYYRDHVSTQLGMVASETPFADLDALLRFYGFDKITSKELEILPPDKLVPPKTPNVDAAIAARYFSPKTSDVSQRSNKLSWRKVVRLKAQPGSEAEKKGLSTLHFLSVAYLDSPEENPFPDGQSRSLNVQIILSRVPGHAANVDSLYWLVFDPKENYKLSYSTTTSWDAADPDLLKGLQPYFVPTACNMCHGGNVSNGVLHSFDTDWYIDKVQAAEDFGPAFAKTKWAPLYDCGNDPKADSYKSAFESFRKLNTEILQQNNAVLQQLLLIDPQRKEAVTLQVERQATSAAKWCELHQSSHQHFEPLSRGIGNQAVERVWKKDDQIDSKLLPLLNRYCYRCHSSVRYNVFIKEDLIKVPANGDPQLVDTMLEMLCLPKLKNRMPQDRDMRKLHPADWKRLVELLESLKARYQ